MSGPRRELGLRFQSALDQLWPDCYHTGLLVARTPLECDGLPSLWYSVTREIRGQLRRHYGLSYQNRYNKATAGSRTPKNEDLRSRRRK
jgi:hypothetical protein